MVRVRTDRCPIRGGIHTRKRMKVLDEVRLVIVAARKRDVGPLDLPVVADLLQDALESTNPAEQLRRQTNLVGEHVEEAPMAETYPGGYIANPDDRGIMLEYPDGVDNSRMKPQSPGQSPNQETLDNLELP